MNRIQKVLEGGHIKLSSVVTDVLGVSGRRILHALVAAVLMGDLGAHQRCLLGQLLQHEDELTAHVAALDAEITRRVDPQAATNALLDTFPGSDRRTAEAIVAESGTDLTRFPPAAPLAAWAGLAPGQHESAGKQRHAAIRQGNPARRVGPRAWAASHLKTTVLEARYRRWVKRMPAKKAIVALAHRLLVIVYHVLTTHTPYQELGATDHDARDRFQIVHPGGRAAPPPGVRRHPRTPRAGRRHGLILHPLAQPPAPSRSGRPVPCPLSVRSCSGQC